MVLTVATDSIHSNTRLTTWSKRKRARHTSKTYSVLIVNCVRPQTNVEMRAVRKSITASILYIPSAVLPDIKSI